MDPRHICLHGWGRQGHSEPACGQRLCKARHAAAGIKQTRRSAVLNSASCACCAQVHGDYSAEVGEKIERPAEEIPGAATEEKAEA